MIKANHLLRTKNYQSVLNNFHRKFFQVMILCILKQDSGNFGDKIPILSRKIWYDAVQTHFTPSFVGRDPPFGLTAALTNKSPLSKIEWQNCQHPHRKAYSQCEPSHLIIDNYVTSTSQRELRTLWQHIHHLETVCWSENPTMFNCQRWQMRSSWKFGYYYGSLSSQTTATTTIFFTRIHRFLDFTAEELACKLFLNQHRFYNRQCG